ncbi:MAG: two-component system, OmpR family, sensor histidine kinase SenX3 [Acidimicrobiaceae bacterium]|nr:two-component system, OmpR family, sensor histidine kinase SenX3 [Acidimicrobiaceae bacterium]
MRAAVLRRVAVALARLNAVVDRPAPTFDREPVGGAGAVDLRAGNAPALAPRRGTATAVLTAPAGNAASSAGGSGANAGAKAGAGAGAAAGAGTGGLDDVGGGHGAGRSDGDVAAPETEVPTSVDGMLRLVEAAVARATSRLAEVEATTNRLAAALAHVPEGVVIADQTGAIVYRNPQAASFVGARHSEALAERSLGELLASALDGRSVEEHIELFSPPRRTLAIRARPLVEAGQPAGAIAIIEDVSEKRRLEAIRRDFVANISHELKTPVGALSLVAETLEDEDDPAIVARLSHRMRTEAERLGRIIEDLLDLSRIEAQEAPSTDPVPVHLVVGQAVDRLRPVADHRGIRLQVTEAPRDLIVLGDRRQLISAMHNLVDNAIKYSEPGSAVQVDVSHDPDWIVLSVADRGIGIPSRDLERVFERFYRVDRARSRDTGGTGLGLSIVRHVAGNHGGEVTLESREGEGSTFRLRLPNGSRAADGRDPEPRRG